MIEIDDPPKPYTCASCWAPITWLWHPRRGWCDMATGDDADTLTVHRCTTGAAKGWRHITRQPPEVHRRGVERARRAVANALEGEPDATE